MKKKYLSLLSIFVLSFCLMGVVSYAEASDQMVWKITSARPEGSPIVNDLHRFSDQVLKASDGRIKIDVYPSGQLGSDQDVMERVSMGTIEMTWQCLSTTSDRRLQLQFLPYLASTWEEARRIFGEDSALIQIIKEIVREQNIEVIAEWPVYFGGIATTKPAESPEDPDIKKGLKLRVPPMKAFSLCAQNLGYQATPLSFTEIFTALQTGIVDGAIGSGGEGYYSNFRDLVKHYYPVNDHFEIWTLCVNGDLWKSLSPSDQDLVRSAAEEITKQRWDVAEQDTLLYENKLKDCGVEIHHFTDEQLEGFAKKIRKNVWPKLRKDIGSDMMDRILAAVGYSEEN